MLGLRFSGATLPSFCFHMLVISYERFLNEVFCIRFPNSVSSEHLMSVYF